MPRLTYRVIGLGHREDACFCEAPPPSTSEFPQSQSRATQRHDGQIGELWSSASSREPSHPGSPAAAIRSIVLFAGDVREGDTATDSSTSDDTCYHSEGLVRSDFDSSEEARCNAGAGGGGRRRRATTVFFCRLSIVLFSRNGLTPRRSPPPSSASGTRASPVRRVVQPSDWELAARLPVRPFET